MTPVTMKAFWLLPALSLANAAQILFQNQLDGTHIAAQAKPTTVSRPRSLEALHGARLKSLIHAQSEPVEWDAVETLGPDIEDRHTLVQLARMAGDAYSLPGSSNWYDVDDVWNTVRVSPQPSHTAQRFQSFPLGWQGSDGFRGHVFLSSDNSTVVLAIKGTTLQGPTSKQDKFNDNLYALSPPSLAALSPSPDSSHAVAPVWTLPGCSRLSATATPATGAAIINA